MADRFFNGLENPKYPHLIRPGGGLAGEIFDLREDISRGFDRVDVGCTSQTTEELCVWMHPQNGDDTNDGLSEATAKKTWVGVFSLLPTVIKHKVSIQVRGLVSESMPEKLSNRVLLENIYVDGGPEVTELLSSTTADISSTLSIGLSTATWTVDQFAGKGWVEILDGPAAGERRSIQRNSATTIVPTIGFSTDPGACSFRVVRPQTELRGLSRISSYSLGGSYVLQRLFIGNGTYAGIEMYGYNIMFSHIINESSYEYTFYAATGTVAIRYDYRLYDTLNSFAYDSLSKCGVSKLGDGATNPIGPCASVHMEAVYFKSIKFASIAAGVAIYNGSRFSDLQLWGTPVIYTVENFQNCPPILFSDSQMRGLLCADGSHAYFGDNQAEFNNNTTYGIEVVASKLGFMGNATGTGNGKLGLRASQNSVVRFKAGSAPTLTGAAGDVSVSDPDAQESTWAAIEAGTPVAVLSELTTVNKAVNPGV